MSLFGKGPITFRHVRRRGDAGSGEVWHCEQCGYRAHLIHVPNSGIPTASPALSLEIPPWKLANQTRADYEEAQLAALRMGGRHVVAPTSAWVDYCRNCIGKGREAKQRLIEEFQNTTTAPVLDWQRGYNISAMIPWLEERRSFAVLQDESDLEWRCLACYKRVHYAETKNPELPAVNVKLEAIRDGYGRVTSAAVTASLCSKCAPAIDAQARELQAGKSA